MEAYVDDMLVKSKEAKDHVRHLSKMFQILREYRMKLNPQKYVFEVESGKFLGFIANNRGIEANPAKIRALLEMRSPRRVKDVQSLTGRVAALNHFVSKSFDKCQEFFNTIKGVGRNFEWTEKCEEAFQNIKKHLSSPPILSNPKEGETWVLYLAVSNFAVSAVLVQEEDGIQLPVYYVSKRLADAETRDGAGAGIELISPEAYKIRRVTYLAFHATNNNVEYEALTNGLKLALEMKVENLNVFSDSIIVVRLELIPLGQNEGADELAKLSSRREATLLGVLPLDIQRQPSVPEHEVGSLSDDLSLICMTPILAYIKEGSLSDEKNEARRIRYKAARYVIYDGILYRRGFSVPLLKCIDGDECNYILGEVHEGICGNHSGVAL
ncbi:uncharacterized protein LOC141687099 [Apium graveolens]|uniref:uncharacterized protein LOC141687099 n=1 Tax=Apium graveolens TaxID=4045 RepID=UPI003D7A6595